MLQSIWSLPRNPCWGPDRSPRIIRWPPLGKLLRAAVERIAEVMGVPLAMAAQSVLATSALAT